MRVADVMRTSVVTVTPDDDVHTVLRLLETHRVTTLPVVDEGRVVAMVGEADVVRALVRRDPRAHVRLVSGTSAVGSPEPLRVVDLMAAPAWSVHPADDVYDVAVVLARHGWKSAAVVDDDDRLVGVVSRSDVIRALTRPDDAVAADVRAVLSELGQERLEVSVRHGAVRLSGSADDRALAAACQAAAAVVGVRAVLPVRTQVGSGA